MCKKLLTVLLVLVLSSMASAGSYYFMGTDLSNPTAWEVSGNWSLGAWDGTGPAGLPTATDFARISNNLGGATITVTGTGQGVKIQTRNAASTLTVSGTLNSGGSLELDCSPSGTDATLNISAGGVVNATAGEVKIGRASRTGGTIVNVDGTLNASGGTGISIGTWSAGGASGENWDLNINNGGVVNSNALAVNTNAADGAANINISGTGKLILDGNVQQAISLLRASGHIDGDGIAGGVSMDYNTSNAGKTTVYVPEPATIALLGLGGLLLRKRR